MASFTKRFSDVTQMVSNKNQSTRRGLVNQADRADIPSGIESWLPGPMTSMLGT
jgi:hypothetical protein